jgi:hypothetical protein
VNELDDPQWWSGASPRLVQRMIKHNLRTKSELRAFILSDSFIREKWPKIRWEQAANMAGVDPRYFDYIVNRKAIVKALLLLSRFGYRISPPDEKELPWMTEILRSK